MERVDNTPVEGSRWTDVMSLTHLAGNWTALLDSRGWVWQKSRGVWKNAVDENEYKAPRHSPWTIIRWEDKNTDPSS